MARIVISGSPGVVSETWAFRRDLSRSCNRWACLGIAQSGWNSDGSLTTRRRPAVTLAPTKSRDTMNRPLHLLIELAAAAAVGCFSAYAFLSAHTGVPGPFSAPAAGLLATAGRAVSSPAPGVDAAVSYPAEGK